MDEAKPMQCSRLKRRRSRISSRKSPSWLERKRVVIPFATATSICRRQIHHLQADASFLVPYALLVQSLAHSLVLIRPDSKVVSVADKKHICPAFTVCCGRPALWRRRQAGERRRRRPWRNVRSVRAGWVSSVHWLHLENS